MTDRLDIRLVYALGVVLAGGIVLGFSGFGAGLIFVPLFSLIYSPREAVALLMLMGALGTSMLVPQAARHTVWREALPMALAAIVAIPAGIMILLTTIDADSMRRIIGGAVLGLSLLMFRGMSYAGPRGIGASMVAGVICGTVAGSTGLGRLIVGLYFLSAQESAAVQRANIIVVGSALAVFSLIVLTLTGVVTLELAARAGVLFLPFAATIWLGSKFFRASTGTLFRRVVLSMVMVIALITVFA